MADRPLSIDIRNPLILKSGELCLLTRQDGDIALDIPGFGLFYRDTCYLGSYGLHLHDSDPLVLMASDVEGYCARIELTNDSLKSANGRAIPDHKLSLSRTLLLIPDEPVAMDCLTFTNFSDQAIALPVSLSFSTAFESLFVLRGAARGERGRLLTPEWIGETLRFCYEGADGLRRSLLATFSLPVLVAPRTMERTTAHFTLALEPRERFDFIVRLQVDERPLDVAPPRFSFPPQAPKPFHEAAALRSGQSLARYARTQTSSERLQDVLARSLSDLALLEIQRGEHRFAAAGVPWFVGLFGRDTLLPSIQCRAFNPDLAAHTVRALAALQGKKDDPRTREQPGKILHELRVGERAHLHEATQTPSYAAVDSTPLFLVAIARHVTWTGELAFFHEMRPAIDAALGWLDRKLHEGQGYVTYEGVADDGGPVNQSWRDSGGGVLRADGRYPEPPLALVEVQGYAYQAMTLIAALLRRVGEDGRADALEASAKALQERFLRDFWMEAEGCYCLALEKGGRQVASVTSNAAQVLWTGISTPEHAARVAARIMRPDMFSGWGVRTLSADHPGFDPLAYQQGSLWPFDNSLIVAGLRRYGEDAAALRIVAATLEAAGAFTRGRLPEFFAGFQRQPGARPVRTPRADPLQAWSAAATPFMVSELLGLQADGFNHVLAIERPLLPEGVDAISLHGMRVAGGACSIGFRRRDGAVEVDVLEAEGVSVEIEKRS